MKKIILAFDGGNFSKGAFEIARQLNAKEPILLSGIFLPQIIFSSPLSYTKRSKGTPVYIPIFSEEEIEAIEKNIERFKMFCLSNRIEHRVHKDFDDFPLSELAKETRYADLLILGSEIFYEELDSIKPNFYLENALHHSECPAIVVPEKFNFPESVIITYDGGKNCVYAIKQFVYLFPELTNMRTLVLYCDNKNNEAPEKSNIEELLAKHFSDLAFFTVDTDFKKYFTAWTIKNPVPIVIAGSYGRSALSQLFKKSFITEIIIKYKTPVFIAHK